MSTLLVLTLIAVVVTVCIVVLAADMPGEREHDDFPSILIQIMWIPLAALWGLSWILSWLR